MPYTAHGHWYGPGEPAAPGPRFRAVCGGPTLCPDCGREAAADTTVMRREDVPDELVALAQHLTLDLDFVRDILAAVLPADRAVERVKAAGELRHDAATAWADSHGAGVAAPRREKLRARAAELQLAATRITRAPVGMQRDDRAEVAERLKALEDLEPSVDPPPCTCFTTNPHAVNCRYRYWLATREDQPHA